MSQISREDYDQLAAFVASVKDRVWLRCGAKIFSLTLVPFEALGKQSLKFLLGWDFDGIVRTWYKNGCADLDAYESICDLMVGTTVIKREPLPEVTPEIINDLFNKGELYFYNQKINHLILTPDEKSFAGSFCKKDGTYGVFCGAFNQTNDFGFYSKTETTTRVPFSEAFKQFQANALNAPPPVSNTRSQTQPTKNQTKS